MAEHSPTLRPSRPRTPCKGELPLQAEAPDGEEEENDANPIDEEELNNVDEPKDPGSNEDNENNPDDDDNDDNYDEDEPRLTIKEEPEDEVSDEKMFQDRVYECKSCTPHTEFEKLAEYLEHLKDVHHEKTTCYECPHCNFISQHPKRLHRHILTAHKSIKDTAIEDTSLHKCTMCIYIAINVADLENHQRFHHLKRRFFRCSKCSYMTHVRARYTKHVKYHSMPMIKCDDCDFRTPYKWNLDRHTRNHGGGGDFQCRACNFTADIRQSLTVHETNHHEPPLTQFAKKQNNLLDRKRCGIKRYNQVGASDYRDLPEQDEPSPKKSGTSVLLSSTLNSTVKPTVTTENSQEDPSSSIAGAECIALKCDEKGCQFITAWDSEMQRHLAESHSPSQSPNKSRKPVPMLIPLSPESKPKSTISNGSPPIVQVPRVRVRPELAKIARDSEIAKLYNNREMITLNKEGKTHSFEKRNAIFFDKLKERLMTTNPSPHSSQIAVSSLDDLKCWCTFEASSQEQLVEHKKTHHIALSVSSVGASRCPKCHRFFKDETDLRMHKQHCHATSDNFIIKSSSQDSSGDITGTCFDEFEYPIQADFDGSNGGPNSSESSGEGPSNSVTRRVFKCPHCPFWASTASRFHVHIVGHLNRKPFECSLCAYRSNWRWDITKHIKLKAARDPDHMNARVLMTDETGRRNYSKYNKYLVHMVQQNTEDNDECGPNELRTQQSSKKLLIMNNKGNTLSTHLTQFSYQKTTSNTVGLSRSQTVRRQGQSLLKNSTASPSATITNLSEQSKRTLWKCKRCNYRDSNKEMVLLHVKSHYDSMDHAADSEKENPLACNNCPFIATDDSVLALHQVHHRPNLEAIFKCYLCPYYVSTKMELLEHARLHGEELAVVHQRGVSSSPNTNRSPLQSENTSSQMDISVEEVTHATSPLLAAVAAKKNEGSDSAPPLLLDTRALPDTPLVWVSRSDGTFAKMLKCRHCPHVSSRRAEVHEHETMHSESSSIPQAIACPDCSFRCDLTEVMEGHAAMHQGTLGTVHCLVDENRSDAQQLEDLSSLLGLPKTPTLGPEPDLYDNRLVHCCNKCPARFLVERELLIHVKYHTTDQAYCCEWCSYRARQPVHLLAHEKAHSTEYQNRTRYLLSLYGHSQRYPPPKTACVEINTQVERSSMNVAWIVVHPVTNEDNNFQSDSNTEQMIENQVSQVFTCAKCPARYFKLDALEYHMTLHGSNNKFKCGECDYASKTTQNLMKHQVVHRRHTESSEPSTTRQTTTPDPQFGNFMRGNPNFVYQGYMRNGRLREKRYKCHKCPSAFEKREQYRVHLTLHGAKQKFRCDTCDYSVKYYANYVQHLKKHHANAEAQASKRQMEMVVFNSGADNESEDKDVVKSRRKSTISSGSGLGLVGAMGSISSISNQDKQSMLLSQKKGDSLFSEEDNAKLLRCHECPFSSTDKETLDTHKRRHGLDRLTPPCPHCNYVPRKDENASEHIKLHFTRLYKPESYLVLEMLTLHLQRLKSNKKDDKQKENELLFRDCGDGKFFPAANSNPLLNVTNGKSLQEKVIVDPNTGEATHRFST